MKIAGLIGLIFLLFTFSVLLLGALAGLIIRKQNKSRQDSSKKEGA